MKRISAVMAIAMLLVTAPAAIAGGAFGLGVMVGEPTGLSAKLWADRGAAFDFGLARSTAENADLAFHADFVRHRRGVPGVQDGTLPFYYGLGVRLRTRDGVDDDLGVRLPLGLDFLMVDSSFDVFVEVVPVLDVSPGTDLDLNAAVGARYFF